MSAVFNGTSSLLWAANAILGSTPTYPVLFAMRVKLDNVANPFTHIAVTDNNAASADYLDLRTAGTVANDPTQANTRTAGGSFGTGSFDGTTAGSWLNVAAYFVSITSRYAWRNGSFGSENTLSRNPTGLSHVSIGALYLSGAGSNFSGMRGCDAAVWNGINATVATSTVLPQFQLGVRPNQIVAGLSTLVFYQPFVAGANEATKVGPTLTEVDMTYDSNDHPTLLYPPWWTREPMMGGFTNG